MPRLLDIVNEAALNHTSTSFAKICNIPPGIPRDCVIDAVMQCAPVVWSDSYMHWNNPYTMVVEVEGIIVSKNVILMAIKDLASQYGLQMGAKMPGMEYPMKTFKKPMPRTPSHLLRVVCFIQGEKSPGFAMRQQVAVLTARWVGEAVSSETKLCPMEWGNGRLTVVLRLNRVGDVDRALDELDMAERRISTGHRVFIYPTQRGEKKDWYGRRHVAYKPDPAATAYQAPPIASGIGMAQQAPPAGAVPPVTPLLASPPAVAPRVTPPPAAALGSAGASREEVEARRQAIREAKEFVESNLEYIA